MVFHNIQHKLFILLLVSFLNGSKIFDDERNSKLKNSNRLQADNKKSDKSREIDFYTISLIIYLGLVLLVISTYITYEFIYKKAKSRPKPPPNGLDKVCIDKESAPMLQTDQEDITTIEDNKIVSFWRSLKFT